MPNAINAKVDKARRILLLGDAGSGKTSQFLTLEGSKFAYLFDPNALASLHGYDLEYEEFLPDRLNLSVKSLKKDVGDKTTNFKNDTYVDFEKDFNARLDSGYFNTIDNIMFDSATTLLGLIMDRVLTINGRAGNWPQQDDYGPQMMTFQNIVRTLTGMGKNVIMTGHLDVKQDELTKRIFRAPMMTGQLKQRIPLLFTDIYLCEAVTDPQKGKVNYKIMTAPDRMTTSVRCSMRGVNAIEDVTIDWSKDPVGQGIGGLVARDLKARS